MASNFVEYYLQLQDARLDRPINDDTGVYNVLTAGDPAELTIYSDASGSSQTNPGTMTDGIIQFWVDSATTSVDISVLTATGHSFFLEGVTISDHKIMVDTERISQTLIVPYSCNTACNVSVDPLGGLMPLPLGAKIRDVFLHATDTATVGSLNVGNQTDPNGFLAVALASTTGWKVYDAPIYQTGTSDSAHNISGTQIRGALLVEFASGSTTNLDGSGYWAPKKYTVADATSGGTLVYEVTATNSGGTGAGYIYVVYDRAPTQGN